jgi:tRNA (guanine6-N2)-methyltransferase
MKNRYFATFVSGFKKVIAEIMRKQFPDIHVEEIYDNLIVFSTDRNLDGKSHIPFLNNLCLLGNKFGSPAMQDFDKIIDWSINKDTFWQVIESYIKRNNLRKYRIYFFENVTTVSDQDNLTILKDFLSETLNLKYSATESEFEIWFVKRREGISLFGIRLTKKQDYQEVLPQGQLRDELAYLLCAYANPEKNDTVLDPFCGYGSIPFTIAEEFKVKKIFASDTDTERIRGKINKENTNRIL